MSLQKIANYLEVKYKLAEENSPLDLGSGMDYTSWFRKLSASGAAPNLVKFLEQMHAARPGESLSIDPMMHHSAKKEWASVKADTPADIAQRVDSELNSVRF